jgi:2-(1,2-epoxy-1,2-dihydrophenyl)acetyl-CoA isomerase
MAGRIEEKSADGVTWLTMHQPGKKNAMTAEMRDTLKERISVLGHDPGARGIVLTGAGGDFSAGGDIQGLMAVDPADFRAYLKKGHELVSALWAFEKPAVAAIEGVGVGGGLALAMCCDHIVAGRSARIGFTFVRIGFVPDWGTLYTVTRRVGWARARRLFLDAGLVGANDALAIGLVDEVVADDEVQSAAAAAVERLAARPKRAYAYTKRFLQNMPVSLDQALEFEAMVQENCFKSDEFFEGVEPFLSGN